MKEVKNPKKPLAYYYSITLIALLLFNIFVAPLLNRQHVEQTDYSTFMRMIAEKKIGKVDVSDTEIIFTDKDDNTIYVTGLCTIRRSRSACTIPARNLPRILSRPCRRC